MELPGTVFGRDTLYLTKYHTILGFGATVVGSHPPAPNLPFCGPGADHEVRGVLAGAVCAGGACKLLLLLTAIVRLFPRP